MAEIIPAIIGQNFAEIENKIHQIERSADWVHLDIMDGTLTRQSSWRTPADLESVPGKIKIESHLMIRRPEEFLPEWLAAADRILIHVEATETLTEIIDSFTGTAVALGLAINLNTPLSKFSQFINQVKLVQLMAIAEIGEQGHPFDKQVLGKIEFLRTSYPDVKIQIDGGVTLDNARSLIEAGADNLVVGSALWQTFDPVKSLKEFQSLLL